MVRFDQSVPGNNVYEEWSYSPPEDDTSEDWSSTAPLVSSTLC